MATQKKQTKNSERSIKSQLEQLTEEKAVCEYVWNAFDAGATQVSIQATPNGISGISSIEITDDGDSINYDELDEVFGNFLDSKKNIERSPITRGRKGKGRFSFFKFSDKANWVCWKDGTEFSIDIVSTHLNEYIHTEPKEIEKKGKGVIVRFDSVSTSEEKFFGEISTFIQNDISWLLVAKPFLTVSINGKKLKPIDYVSKIVPIPLGELSFQVKTVVWSHKPVIERSYIYYMNSSGEVVHRELSELNKKGFDCSAYITSDWFDSFSVNNDLIDEAKNHTGSDEFKFISLQAKGLLKEEYRAYKNNAVDRLIQEYLKDGIFPEYKGDNRFLNEFKREQLIETIKVIYEAEPTIFSSLNKKQKKILVKLLDRIIDTNNLSSLFDILEGIVSLSDDDVDKLASVIRRTSLSNIARTISFISDRLDVLEFFKEILYTHRKKTYEVKHIQKCVENNLWLFGEQYGLLASEEDKFDKVLRKYLSTVKGFSEEHFDKYSIEHPDKYKELDIFAAQKSKRYLDNNEEYFHCVIIELKKPSIKLGDTELEQIKLYKNIIAATDEFHDEKTIWDFILIGNEISDSKITAANIRSELESNRIHGEFGLVQKTGNMRIYVKTWKQIINEYELRYHELTDKLKLQELDIVQNTPDALVEEVVKKSKLLIT